MSKPTASAGLLVKLAMRTARDKILTVATVAGYAALPSEFGRIAMTPMAGHIRQVPVESTSAARASPMHEIPPNRISEAHFVSPGRIDLRFGDGQQYSLATSLLDMPLDRIDWPTLKVSPNGNTVIVKGIKGDPVPIDSATLRYLVDDKYAAKTDKALESLRLSREELAEMARDNPPPPEWYDEPEQDFTRESWK